ncbi:cytochrome P450 [Rhizopogon salebrosus TDB-379]|nr:cytochrome P450 [Rhizopogon salebrosus TDB-379]
MVYKKRSLAEYSKDGIRLPPGPPPRWFWSNALPTVNIAHAFTEFVRKYGPLVSFQQGSQVIIVIGSVQAATEIMEKEGGSLMDRPRSIAAGEILSRGMRILMSSGDRFRRFRKAVHTHLQPKAMQAYRDMQCENARIFILDVLDDPKNHQKHASRFAASVILRVTYGKSTPTAADDPEVARIRKVMEVFQIVMRPGAFLVDRVPILRYFPGYGKQLTEWRRQELGLYSHQLGRVKSEMGQNKAGPSFAKTLLENIKQHGLTTDEMSYLAGSLFGAGSDTTSVAVTNVTMAAACHPLAQAKVHEELDGIIGSARAPGFGDESSLPQLHAFIWEALRWRPVVPIGFPHCAIRDVIWQGYYIPKGATVYGCHWAISRDPIAYLDPEKFDPQRWLNSEGRLRDDMKSFTYGFGRRLALLFWSFRIAQRPDAPINIHTFSDTIVSRAAPFEVEFIPRVDVAKLREMMVTAGLRVDSLI